MGLNHPAMLNVIPCCNIQIIWSVNNIMHNIRIQCVHLIYMHNSVLTKSFRYLLTCILSYLCWQFLIFNDRGVVLLVLIVRHRYWNTHKAYTHINIIRPNTRPHDAWNNTIYKRKPSHVPTTQRVWKKKYG